MGIAQSSLVRLASRSRRFVLLTLVLAPTILLLLLGAAWLQDHVPRRVFWRGSLAFLIVLEGVYVMTAVSAVIGLPILSLACVRFRARRLAAARGLLACISVLFGLFLTELVCGIVYGRHRRSSVMPVGGLSRARNAKDGLWPPVKLEQIDLPRQFSDRPGEPEIDLVVVGESSAEGVPYNEWVSIGRLVSWQLEKAIPGRPVRLQVIATSGETLELQHQRLVNLIHRPDLIIVYCGHNEFGSRLPEGREVDHYLDERLPGTWRLAAERVESVSAACALIHETAEKCRLAIPPPRYGYRKLVDVPAYTPAEHALLLADFRRRLETIAAYSEQLGAITVLIAPPANDAGFEPNRSFLHPSTPRADRAAFQRDFESARSRESVDRAKAIAAYRKLLDRQPGFAEAHYRLARLLDESGEAEEAYRHFVAARDHDGYPTRCLTAFQEAYRAVAARHHAILIDGQSYFHAIGPRGLLNNHLFHDGMHPSLRGQIALAQGVLVALRDRRAFGWPEGSPAPVIDPEHCVAQFRVDAHVWRYICLWGIMFYQLTAPLRYDPQPRVQLQFTYADAADRIEAGEAPESLGLPNVGRPEAIPVVPVETLRGQSPSRKSRPERRQDAPSG